MQTPRGVERCTTNVPLFFDRIHYVHYSRISSEFELKHGHGLKLGLELRRDFELEHGHGLEAAEISKKRLEFGARVALWWSGNLQALGYSAHFYALRVQQWFLP